MAVIQRVLSHADSNYKNDFITLCLELHGDDLSGDEFMDLTEGINLDKIEYFVDILNQDLTDHGFNESEIYGIIHQSFDKELAYKYIAYAVSLVNEYSNIDEFNEIIKDEYFIDEGVTAEDFEQIYKAYQTLC